MLTPSFAFAVLTFVLLLLFFSGLPNLKTCELPHALKKTSRIVRTGSLSC